MKKIRKKITTKSGSLFDKLFTLNYNDINMMQEESSVEEKDISRAVIKRLPRYYRYLGELMEDGVERISSNDSDSRDTDITLNISIRKLQKSWGWIAHTI